MLERGSNFLCFNFRRKNANNFLLFLKICVCYVDPSTDLLPRSQVPRGNCTVFALLFCDLHIYLVRYQARLVSLRAKIYLGRALLPHSRRCI